MGKGPERSNPLSTPDGGTHVPADAAPFHLPPPVQAVLESLPCAVLGTDGAGRVLPLNTVARELCGSDSPLDAEQVWPQARRRELVRGGTPREWELQAGSRGLRVRETGLSGTPGGWPVAVALVWDATGERAAEQRLGQLQQWSYHLEAVLGTAYDAALVLDGSGAIQQALGDCSRLLGSEAAGLAGSQLAGLERSGALDPAPVREAIAHRRPVTAAQVTPAGRRLLVAVTPELRGDRLTLLVVTLRDVTESHALRRELAAAQSALSGLRAVAGEPGPARPGTADDTGQPIFRSLRMQRLLALLDRVAAVDSTVLLLGESGTGKGLLARYLHQAGIRRDQPYVQVNVGAMPESLIESELFGYEAGAFTGARPGGKTGMFEVAGAGTLFVDEIGDIPLPLQVKLLNVLQDRQFYRVGGTRPLELRARLVAATHRDLAEAVQEGRFREDLYYRLNVVPVQVPPLRARKEDIPALAAHFVARYNARHGRSLALPAAVLGAFLAYDWPGNVRELENLIERLVVVTEGDSITLADLPDHVYPGHRLLPGEEPAPAGQAPDDAPVVVRRVVPLKVAIRLLEEQLLRQAFQRAGNTYEMARLLKVNQSTIVRKIHQYFGRLRGDHTDP